MGGLKALQALPWQCQESFRRVLLIFTCHVGFEWKIFAVYYAVLPFNTFFQFDIRTPIMYGSRLCQKVSGYWTVSTKRHTGNEHASLRCIQKRKSEHIYRDLYSNKNCDLHNHSQYITTIFKIYDKALSVWKSIKQPKKII